MYFYALPDQWLHRLLRYSNFRAAKRGFTTMAAMSVGTPIIWMRKKKTTHYQWLHPLANDVKNTSPWCNFACKNSSSIFFYWITIAPRFSKYSPQMRLIVCFKRWNWMLWSGETSYISSNPQREKKNLCYYRFGSSPYGISTMRLFSSRRLWTGYSLNNGTSVEFLD